MISNFLYNPKELGDFAHCAHLLELDNGDLLAAWYAHPDTEDHRNAQLVLARKPRDKDWTPSRRILGPFHLSAGNPVLCYDAGTNTLWMYFALLQTYWTDGKLYVAASKDYGETWSSHSQLWDQKGLMLRHPPVALISDEFLMPVYDEVKHTSLVFRGKGEHWKLIHEFDGPVIQPVIVRDQAQTLRIFFRPKSKPKIIWRAQSTDNGKSWSALIKTSLPCPNSGIAAFTCGSAIGLAYNHTTEHARTPLSLALSTDGGVSWSEPWHIDEIGHEASYPNFLTTADGHIHGVYTYNRRMIKYLSFTQRELEHGLY